MQSQRFEGEITTPLGTTRLAAPAPPIEVPAGSVSEEETLLSAAAGPFAANRYVGDFQKELSSWRIHQEFQTQRTAAIRQPQITRHETRLNSDGQNLLPVLHTLYTGDRDFKNEVNTAMQAAFGNDFDSLEFRPAADGRTQLEIRWRSLHRQRTAADISDGTLRFLFLMTILADPAPPSLVAIDEPETGLHPSMLPVIAEYARDAANRSQVILATHSPEFLDAFGHDPPTTTIVEREEGQTVLRVVAGDDLSYWLKQYTLGELFRSRELEAMK